MTVFDQCIDLGRCRCNRSQMAVAVEIKDDMFARGHNHTAHMRDHETRIADLRRQQGDIAIFCGANFAFINNVAKRAIAMKRISAIEIFRLVNVHRRGGQGADIKARIGTEIYPGRVLQNDFTRGVDLAKNLARRNAVHLIQRRRLSIGLVEINRRIRAHIKLVPADDRAASGLMNIEGRGRTIR